jgi:hypothetical protein
LQLLSAIIIHYQQISNDVRLFSTLLKIILTDF